jgi:hypothetical protein
VVTNPVLLFPHINESNLRPSEECTHEPNP